MKIRTVKKVLKECWIKGRKSPLAKKVTLDHIAFYRDNQDRRKRHDKSRRKGTLPYYD